MSHTEHQSQSQSITPRCAVVTLSDTRTTDTDTSGQLMQRLLVESGAIVDSYHLIPDDPHQLKSLLDQLLHSKTVQVILTNGGTGISPRDQTIDVIEKIIEKPLPGFGEIFRMLSYNQIGSAAILSRAVAGIAQGKAIFSTPGSTKAVELAMKQIICPQLKHIIRELNR